MDLTYSQDFLSVMDGGGDISPLIKITEPKSQRQFQSFSYGSITSNYSVNGYIIDGSSSSTMNWEGGTITNNNGSSGIIDANDTSITVYNTSGNTAS